MEPVGRRKHFKGGQALGCTHASLSLIHQIRKSVHSSTSFSPADRFHPVDDWPHYTTRAFIFVVPIPNPEQNLLSLPHFLHHLPRTLTYDSIRDIDKQE
jgi:hypothetical protein